MLRRIKQYLQTNKDLRQRIIVLEQANAELAQGLSNYKHMNSKLADLLTGNDAENVVAKIMDRGISWYDYKKLPIAKQVEYYTGAQAVLNNNVYVNEMKHTISDLVQHIAKRSPDFESVRDLRMTINGMELLRERLEGIYNPTQEAQEATEPYAGV